MNATRGTRQQHRTTSCARAHRWLRVLIAVLTMGAFVVGTQALSPASANAEAAENPVGSLCAIWLFSNLELCAAAQDDEGAGGDALIIYVEDTKPVEDTTSPVTIQPSPPPCSRLIHCLPSRPRDPSPGVGAELDDLDRWHQEKAEKKRGDREYAECMKRRKSGPKGETPCAVYCPRSNTFVNPTEDDCVGAQFLPLRTPKLSLDQLLDKHLGMRRVCRRIRMELDYLEKVREKLRANGHFSQETWEAHGAADQWEVAIQKGQDNDCWNVATDL